MSEYQPTTDEQKDDADKLRDISNTFGEFSNQMRALADLADTVSATLRIACGAASDVMYALSFAFGEAADEGHPGPVQSLADATDGWLNETVAFEIVPDPVEIMRLADDGNPHHEEE